MTAYYEEIYSLLESVTFAREIDRILMDRFLDKFADSTAYANIFAADLYLIGETIPQDSNRDDVTKILDKNIHSNEVYALLRAANFNLSQFERVKAFLNGLANGIIDAISAS